MYHREDTILVSSVRQSVWLLTTRSPVPSRHEEMYAHMPERSRGWTQVLLSKDAQVRILLCANVFFFVKESNVYVSKMRWSEEQ